jgi:hypothetical protein
MFVIISPAIYKIKQNGFDDYFIREKEIIIDNSYVVNMLTVVEVRQLKVSSASIIVWFIYIFMMQ